MHFSKIAPVLAAVAGTASAAGRPADESICDYYTTALLKNNTAENQATLLTLVVNTVVIGNYTQPNVGVSVPGILAPGMYNGTKVNLAPYFTGDLMSTNRGGDMGVSVNFLDGGGAAPLMKNMPADDMKSNQYFLLTHLYQFFGSLLGCSEQGMPGFDAYTGHASMYEVHKFMDLDPYEVGYFITQVGMSAASFGVADADVTAVGEALMSLFGYRCAPPATAIKAQGPQLQSICIDDTCPLAENSVCGKYDCPAVEPSSAMPMSSSTMMSSMPMSSSMPMTSSMMYPTMTGSSSWMPTPTATGSMSMTMSPTPSSSVPVGAASGNRAGVGAAVIGGLAALLI